MKPVVYHRLAENELVESARFYERRREFLGESFLDAAGETLAKIQANPEFGQPGKFSTRSWKMKRFPFRVVYLEQPDRIWIVAVAHLSRKPNYWLERLD
ncbi:MAG TPA: type II toxin-antitoxin system RelE/ParE family toxin [Verrucomicrobiae bacterium]